MSPTARSLKYLRDNGYVAEVVEKTVPRSFVKKDYIGIVDVIACGNGHILAVQVTTTGNLNARKLKALAEPRLLTWLESGGSFRLHGWSKRGGRGERKKWTLKEIELTIKDFAPIACNN